MARVRAENTKPERTLRRILTDLGFRYRLQRRDIPGRPDFAFIGRRKVIFVHGCFWHGHDCARGSRVPATNVEYWSRKITGNKTRDLTVQEQLKKLGWEGLVLWECELKDPLSIASRVANFLNDEIEGPSEA